MAAPFPLGQIVATPGALKLLEEVVEDPLRYLSRHRSGDWGEINPQDLRENERSFEHSWRILSSYTVGEKRVWIITEADRSVTTILLPEEY
jgi:hypothetical protein